MRIHLEKKSKFGIVTILEHFQLVGDLGALKR